MLTAAAENRLRPTGHDNQQDIAALVKASTLSRRFVQYPSSNCFVERDTVA
jgi:hypothetical protein